MGPAQTRAQESKTKLEALVQIGPDSEAWRSSLVHTDPVRVQFRWRTEYDSVGAVEWEISEDSIAWRVIARGDAAPADDSKSGAFAIDLGAVVGNKTHRPLQYFVRLVTYPANTKARVSRASPVELTAKRDEERVDHRDKPVVRATVTSTGQIRKRATVGVPSRPLSILYVDRGDMTRFTRQGLNPELLTSMPIEISLDTLTIRGEGGDEDPYLFVVAIFADGTTVIPTVDEANQLLRFDSASVRLQSPSKTHENVAGANVDVGVPFDIPESVGRFRTTIRPIGVQLMNTLPLTDNDRQSLRRSTNVAILVIGMEEDAVPSTEVIDDTRRELVRRLQGELDEIVRGVTASTTNPALPNLRRATSGLSSRLREQLKERAIEKGKEEFAANLKFLGFPTVIIVPGAVNIDDFIGSRVEFFTYEQLLNAGPQGLPISMQLNQAWDGLPYYLQMDTTEPIWYLVEGRIRLRL